MSKARCYVCRLEKPKDQFEKGRRTCIACQQKPRTRQQRLEEARTEALGCSGGQNSVITLPKTEAGLCGVRRCVEPGLGRPLRVRIPGGRQADVRLCRHHGKYYIDSHWGVIGDNHEKTRKAS